jgi:HSP20 family molecular chaperone IbpA
MRGDCSSLKQEASHFESNPRLSLADPRQEAHDSRALRRWHGSCTLSGSLAPPSAIPSTNRQENAMTFTTWKPQASVYNPGVNIYENATEVLLEVELPGRKREDVSVEVVDRTLTISAKDADTERDGYEASYRERRRGSLQRSFRLGTDLETDKVHARYENGLLLLSIPKQVAAQARKIEVA